MTKEGYDDICGEQSRLREQIKVAVNPQKMLRGGRAGTGVFLGVSGWHLKTKW